MNIPVGPDGKITWGEPLSKPGDHVVLRAVIDCIVVMSTCPQDMIPINGGRVSADRSALSPAGLTGHQAFRLRARRSDTQCHVPQSLPM